MEDLTISSQEHGGFIRSLFPNVRTIVVSRAPLLSVVHDDLGGNLVWGQSERPIALLGVEGLAIIDTGDAILVTRLDRSNEVRGIVKALKAMGRPDVT